MMRGSSVQASPQAVNVAPAINKADAVLWIGVPLIFASLWHGVPGISDAFGLMVPGLRTLHLDGAQQGSLQDVMLQTGMVLVLYVVARISDSGGSFAIAILAAMWVAFLVRNSDNVARWLGTSAPSSPSNNQGVTK
jgi:hypothetical protein